MAVCLVLLHLLPVAFSKYHGMTAEQFLWAVIKSNCCIRNWCVQSEDIYTRMQETISVGRKESKGWRAEIIYKRAEQKQKQNRKKRKEGVMPSIKTLSQALDG